MSTNYKNVKGNKSIRPESQAHLNEMHELGAGRTGCPRGAANTSIGRESKAVKHSRKK